MTEIKLSERFSKFLLEQKCVKISKDETELFTLKSGRKSPFFVNMGALTGGKSLDFLARSYAEKIVQLVSNSTMQDFDYIYGPAYKGIPLAAITAVALSKGFGKEVKMIYDRKEAKTHGDVGADKILVGGDQFTQGARILIIDDVITSGKSKFEAVEKLRLLGDFKLSGVIVAVDRQEASGDDKEAGPSASEQIKERLGVDLYSIADAGEIYSALKEELTDGQRKLFKDYFSRWGNQKAKKWAEE